MSKEKCTHFSCVSCNKVKRIGERHIVTASYMNWEGSAISPQGSGELRCFHYRVQLCGDCYRAPVKEDGPVEE